MAQTQERTGTEDRRGEEGRGEKRRGGGEERRGTVCLCVGFTTAVHARPFTFRQYPLGILMRRINNENQLRSTSFGIPRTEPSRDRVRMRIGLSIYCGFESQDVGGRRGHARPSGKREQKSCLWPQVLTRYAVSWGKVGIAPVGHEPETLYPCLDSLLHVSDVLYTPRLSP